MTWEPTKHGGFRRTRVAQEKSTAVTQRRSAGRIRSLVLLKFNEKLGLPQCPYLIRWRIETPIGSLRLHHWLGPDDDRAFHDHPWWFWTLVLKGSYIDKSPDGIDHLWRFSHRYRPALHRHTVIPDPEAWTLLITGPPVRS